MIVIVLLLGILLSYLIGAIPTAFILAKIIKGIDIREHGSGNVGATNALRLLGKLPGILVLLIDIIKGLFVVIIVSNIFIEKISWQPEFIKSIFGMAVVCGHVFNVFLSFKGGKGVATSAGVLLGIAPGSFLIGLIFFMLTVIFLRYVSLASIVACIVIPFHMLMIQSCYSHITLSAFLCMIIVIKHKSNINRLLTGNESKVFEKK